MKKALITVLLLGIALFGIYGCAQVSSGGGGGGGTNPTNTIATLTGKITETNGTTNISGVTVTVQSTSAATNSDGWFAITNLRPGASVQVNFSKTGFITTQKIVSLEAGRSVHVTASMLAMGSATAVTVATGGTVTVGGATAMFPAGAFELSDGTAFTGTTANVVVTPTTFATSADADAFPGEFTGVNTAGATVPFESFGWVDIYASGSGTLRVKSGSTMTVTIPNAVPVTPEASSIPVWYYDLTAGAWKAVVDTSGNQEMATYNATNNNFTFQVPGGSAQANLNGLPYNVDLPRSSWAYIKGRVVDSSGVAVQGAHVKIYSSWNNWRQQTSGDNDTRSDGTWGPVAVPPDRDLFVYAISGAKTSNNVSVPPLAAATYTFASPYDAGDLVLDSSRLQFTLTWGADPRDLDSHLTIPKISAEATYRYHLYYSNRYSTPSNSYPYANLDTDDTSGYGPEHTTVYRLYDGTYRFCVHHYAGSSTIQDSGAQVILNADDGRGTANTYIWTPPSQPAGTVVWEVCDVVVSGGRITAVNTLSTYGDQSKATYDPGGEADQVWTTALTTIKSIK